MKLLKVVAEMAFVNILVILCLVLTWMGVKSCIWTGTRIKWQSIICLDLTSWKWLKARCMAYLLSQKSIIVSI